MSSQDFSKSECQRCRCPIWIGLGYSMMMVKLDTTPLNLASEIIAKLKGVRTYEARRTGKSFEVVPRSVGYIGSPNPVVLAQHTCSLLYGAGEPAVDFWGRDATNENSAVGGNQDLTENLEVPF